MAVRGTHDSVGPIRRGDDGDTRELLHAIHLVQQAREDALVRGAALRVG